MKFKKGHVPHNKGKKCSDELRKKISEATKLAMEDPQIRYKCGSATRGKKLPTETKNKMSLSHKGKVFSPNHKINLSISLQGNINFKGKKHSEESKFKIGQKNKISQRGKKQSNETKLKRRKKIIEYIKNTRGGFRVNIGKNESNILNDIEKQSRCNIDRNYEIKELGYICDGYCKETNTIYEVYEKYHDSQVQKDLNREIEICNFLSCDFVIIWDKE